MIDWKTELARIGALWQHDGNPDRPYVRITSGRISNYFEDLSYLVAQPALLAMAAQELAEKVRIYGNPGKNMIICGQQEGSVTLASRIAEELKCGCIYTTKVGEGANKQMVLAERFDGIFPSSDSVILVDDVVTTAGTSHASLIALRQAGFKIFRNMLLAVVDRSNDKNMFGFEIHSCLKLENHTSWLEGENPHTPDGTELKTPVKGKTPMGRLAMRANLV